MSARAIDWSEIHRRLAVAGAAISGEAGHSEEETRRILAARARALAHRPAVVGAATRVDVVAFELAGETWGVETVWVREVCQLKELTALPGTPPFISGVMNLRGRLLAIVDLRKYLGLPARGLTELNRVLVLGREGSELGLLADSIAGVRSLSTEDLRAGLPSLIGPVERFLKGVTGQLLAVLDGERLLADAGLKVDEKVIRDVR